MKYSIVFLFIFLFIFSCKNEDSYNTALNKNFNVRIDTLNIDIDTTFLQYYRHTTFSKDIKRLYAYNNSLHRIDYISLDGKNNGFIPLDKEGPNGIESINDIYIKNENEIFLITYFHIAKINSEGVVISKNAINSKSSKAEHKTHFLSPSQDSGFDYDPEDDVFYILNTNMEYSLRKEPKKFYKNSKLLSKYSFYSNKTTVLDIPYPDEFQEKNFGFNNLAFVCLNDDDIYYSFSSLSDIFIYNTKTNKYKKHRTSTKDLPYFNYDYEDWSSGNYGKNLNTYIFNSNFGSILNNDKYVVRVYLSSTPEHEDKKKSALQIFDKDLNLLKNLKIDGDLAFSGNFSDSENFYFQTASDDENEIRFLKLSILPN